MHRVVKRGVLEFIRPGGTNKWILLCESRQDFPELVVMYENEMPCVNCVQCFDEW